MESSPNATELVVVRHGETVWNAESRIQGHGDSPLTELGVRQSRALAETLCGERVDAIYSSDLPRALRTAEIVGNALGLRPIPDARLRERDHGILEGMTRSEIEARHQRELERIRERDPDHAIPGGESLRDMRARVVCFLEDGIAARHGERIVVVTHGGVLDALFRHAVGLDLAAPKRFSCPNAARNVLRRDGAGWKVILWGDARHLETETIRMGTIRMGTIPTGTTEASRRMGEAHVASRRAL